jgi:hypothetical protein
MCARDVDVDLGRDADDGLGAADHFVAHAKHYRATSTVGHADGHFDHEIERIFLGCCAAIP